MSRPPRRADFIIERAVRRPVVASTIIGDLHEEHAAIRRRRGKLLAALWYWQQALRVAGAFRFGGRRRARGADASDARPRWGADLLLDLRHAARGVRHSPGFAALVVITLALAIGANATMFGIIDRLLISAPPYIVAPDRVVRLHTVAAGPSGERWVMEATSLAVLDDLRDDTDTFRGWAAAGARDAVLGRGEDAISIALSGVSGGYFELLGAEPKLGRFLNETDDHAPLGSHALVISYRLWQRHFAGQRSVLGAEVLLNGTAYAVVGIAPPGFSGDGYAPVDAWTTIHSAFGADGSSWMTDRRRRWVTIIGRLGDGIERATAQQDAGRALAAGARAAGVVAPAEAILAPLTPGRGPQGTSMQARISLWLGGVTLVVLLVAVANVANLLLLRAHRRRHELEVRLALGMGRGRMLRQALAEATLLAALAAPAAMLVAAWSSELLRSWLLPGMAPPATRLDLGIAAATAAATLLAALAAGALPALARTLRSRTARARRAGGPSGGARLRAGLLLAQTSLSVVLLVGAGLFVASLQNVYAQDIGMRLDGVLLAEIRFDGEPSAVEQDEIYRTALVAVRRTDGVDSVVAAQTVPFGPFMTLMIGFPGKDFRALFGGRQTPYFHAVEPAFFELMGIDIVEGRALLPSDDAAAAPVVVISSSLARYVWPGESAVGKCMRAGMKTLPSPASFADGAGDDVPCYQVVGISADVAERSLLPENRLTMQWYTTFEQIPPRPAPMSGDALIQALLIKASGRTDEAAATVRRVMQRSSERIAYVEVRPYRDLIDPGARAWRLGAVLFTAFGGLALLIAAVGIYGVFAYGVSQRTREMGIRMALGARRAHVVRLVLASSLRTVGGGILVGGAVALWAARYIEDLLYDTSGSNPWVLAAVATVLLGVALIASIVPTARATRTDPRVTLTEG